MTRDDDLEATIVAKFLVMAPLLNERARRLWAGANWRWAMARCPGAFAAPGPADRI